MNSVHLNYKISIVAQQMLQHESVDGWRVICAVRCWNFPGQSTTDKKTLQNSHPVVRKKIGWRSHRLFTKKEMVVLVENLYVSRRADRNTVSSGDFCYFVFLLDFMPYILRLILFAWTRGLLHSEKGTWMVRMWVTVWGLPSSRMLCARADKNTGRFCASARP